MQARTKHDPRVDLLSRVPLFSGCSTAELRRIASISTIVDVAAGRVMIREGELRRDFFVIVEGHAKVTMKGELIAILGSGSFFGEMALLNQAARVATVTATEPTTVLSLSSLEFTSLVGAMPQTVARRMLAGVTARLYDADVRAMVTTAGGAGSQPVGVGIGSTPGS
jgi:CRP-like cAMP-binding protein